MLTETFINSCFSVILNKKTKIRRDKTLYRDVLSILEFYETKKRIEIPVTIQNKFDCLKKICELKLEGKTDENAIDSCISFSEKFKPLESFISLRAEENITDAVTLDNVRQIRLRKKVNSLFSNYDQLTTFVESLNSGTFDSIDDLVLDYEEIIKQLYSTMMQENRGIAIESSASLDLSKDDYTPVLQMILKKYEKSNAVATGYPIFDVDVLRGGFEPSRLYVFGGGSGAGKSTLINNLIVNSATTPQLLGEGNISKERKVYVYITLENTIEESLLRTYQPLFNKTIPQVLSEINSGIDIKDRLMIELKRTNSSVIMKYFPAMSISTLDISAVLDDVVSEYGPDSIKGLYVDYLDLLRTDTKYDMYRLELGHITLSLKTLAVEYNIPLITATQLGRSVYRIQESRELSLDQISESIKKIEHADFVALLSKDPVKDDLVHMKVGKNRSGKANMAIDFKVNFSTFKFLKGTKVTNESKQTVVGQELLNFGGLEGKSF